ncbi:MAG: IPExxxVDY family protein [Bacteroidetes bacterium]|nr:IPExxxVDY family protein [Bacteroidota bacterium]
MKKNKLKLELDFDFLLIGIVAAMKDYRLCSLINNTFGIELTKDMNHAILSDPLHKMHKSTISFPPTGNRADSAFINRDKGMEEPPESNVFVIFHYDDDLSKVQYYLINNKIEGDILLPEQSKVDFLLMVRGNHQTVDKEGLIRQLSSIPLVQFVFNIEVDTLASKENLLIE